MSPEDNALLTESYRKYHKDLYLYVAAHLPDSHAVDDVVSETFTLACEKLEQFKRHPNPKAWLVLVARHKTLEMLRRLYDRRLIHLDDETPLSSDCSQYGIREFAITAREALTPEEYRRFLRYFIWGYSLRELAELENVSPATLSVRLSRIRRKLMERL